MVNLWHAVQYYTCLPNPAANTLRLETGPSANACDGVKNMIAPTITPEDSEWTRLLCSPLETEEEFRASTQPSRLLATAYDKGLVTDRKYRLYLAAVCRKVWAFGFERPQAVKAAVALAEQFADGQITFDELRTVLPLPVESGPGPISFMTLRAMEYHMMCPPPDLNAELRHYYPITRREDAASMVFSALNVMKCGLPEKTLSLETKERMHRASFRCFFFGYRPVTLDSGEERILWERQLFPLALARDFFGPLPFREICIDPDWLTWNDGTAVDLAHTIYEERRFEDMPVLGDALEEAGCENAEILDHCRSLDIHARGCWVLDLLLGKK